MAYDPEARENSNTAMIIGIVALVLLVGGALAYFATRSDDVDNVVVTPPAVNERVVENTVEVPVPVNNGAPGTIIVNPPAPRTSTSTTITRDRTTVVRPPAATSGKTGSEAGTTSSAPQSSSNPQVTVNVAPPASGGATTGSTAAGSGATGSATTADGATSNGATGNAATGY